MVLIKLKQSAKSHSEKSISRLPKERDIKVPTMPAALAVTLESLERPRREYSDRFRILDR